ncbi:HutD/Ves family protein [Gordonia insulae]|uniref:Protein Ves n=1 Tax=Gordonia insulae TaxID=2420509 RepID=A0A3G8JPD3_9ACTN|nr:HutD family protein [Gordonia insulae]AZG46535.1 Protein Ves [Gordonia insulae]
MIRVSEVTPTAWRNGGGVTRRIATGGVEPTDAGWTLSLADIETRCQFSTFPGLVRTAVVVGDDPVDLTIDGFTRTLALLDRITFSGEAEVHAEPTRRATRLLNLMTRRGSHEGTLSLRHLRGTHPLGPDDGVACVVLAGTLTVAGARLRRWDTILLDGAPIEAAGAATVAIVRIRPITAPSTEEDTLS